MTPAERKILRDNLMARLEKASNHEVIHISTQLISLGNLEIAASIEERRRAAGTTPQMEGVITS